MALNKFSRKSAEAAPGAIAPAAKETVTRNSSKTKVKSFSLPIDVLDELDDYMYTHRERSASKVVTEALRVYLRTDYDIVIHS